MTSPPVPDPLGTEFIVEFISDSMLVCTVGTTVTAMVSLAVEERLSAESPGKQLTRMNAVAAISVETLPSERYPEKWQPLRISLKPQSPAVSRRGKNVVRIAGVVTLVTKSN